MSTNTHLLLAFVLFAFCLSGNGVYAFGADLGTIIIRSRSCTCRFAYMEGRAFRHGDIEDALSELVKRGAGGFALASIISKGSKFTGLDVKRVYFGNWLRDYSQAVDIASLKKMPLQTIMNLLMVLGFMAHGYATHEFEVTQERVGVYLPVEHIDNPKGYGEGEDPRRYHPALRPPVDPRELEIDPRTGMKNYIANEQGNWDTSRALVRRLLERCIHLGRQHRSQGQKQDEYEAYRLLGQLLHTLEDFPAHSNWCELALAKMGHREVFLHVGDQVRVQAPNGQWVAPIVTGTFGSNDFYHSLLGEATDHLSQASVSDLNKALDNARSSAASSGTRGGPGGGRSQGDVLRDLLFSVPGLTGGDLSREMDAVERIRASSAPQGGGKRPEEMSPQELHSVLWQVLTFRDSVMKKIEITIERIPGLNALVEKISDSISVFVFTTLEPFLKPILKTTTASLGEISSEVINSGDQYEVFNDPRASDPTHSFLSKDHFNLILNEPAGHVARAIVIYTVGLVTKAWDDPSVNVHALSEDVLQCLFHPNFESPNSEIQRKMLQEMYTWVNQLGARSNTIIQRLSKDSVRNHQNIRLVGEGGASAAEGTFAQTEGLQVQHAVFGFANQIPGVAQASHLMNAVGGAGGRKDGPGGGYGERPAPPGTAGQGGSYYGGAPTANPSPGAATQHSHYGPPSGPPPTGSTRPSGPPSSSGYGPPSGPPSSSGYGPPSGPPPSSGYAPPSGPPPSGHAPSFPGHSGYAPSYDPQPHAGYTPSCGPPASFPSAGPGPSFPGASPAAFPGGQGPPPSFPGAMPSFPDAHPGGGPPPSFPGAGPAFPSEHQHQHNAHHQHGHHQHNHHGHQGGPQFPGAQTFPNPKQGW
ncbi:hypothetical protein H0H92_012203 [Tricholoma furcatifolium]|nr:hypothetical protein H0H92_012203 [Tricholoma furcatifolium]